MSDEAENKPEEDEISLENLDALFEEEGDEGSEGADEAEAPSEESAPEEEPPPVFSELSAFGKVKFVVFKIIGFPLVVVNEILYAIGFLENRTKSYSKWLVTDGVTLLKDFAIRRSTWALEKVKSRIPKMPDLSWIKEIQWKKQWPRALAVTLVFGVTFTVWSLWSTFQQMVGREPFLNSFESVAEKVIRFDGDLRESFYSSPRFAAFSLQLPKMIVNLTNTGGGRAPTAFMLFSIEVSSEATLDEVEARKAMVVDKTQRVISEWTFDDLSTAVGKKRLRQKIMDELNQELKTGRVKHLFIESALLKP